MLEAYYIAMCYLHRTVKKILRRSRDPVGFRFVDVTSRDIDEDGMVSFQGLTNPLTKDTGDGRVSIDQVYPVENAVPLGSNPHLRSSFSPKTNSPTTKPSEPVKEESFSPQLWRKFLDNAEIPKGFRNGGLKYAGYIASGRESWCLPSWVWTNAAIVRYLCSVGDIEQATKITNKLLAIQHPSGGWVVRSDYSTTEEIPVLAANDSAYLANNALLAMFNCTGETLYLDAARKCADWIMRTARPDGLVWTGFDLKNEVWITTHTIVDTGFTAGLFANLYLLTAEDRYRAFLERFVERFVEVFYDPKAKSFATSVDKHNTWVGGRFARGQAWALEGLIPAYQALKSDWLEEVILSNISTIKGQQLSNGGWAYNFDKAYLGEDCKGVPVLAKALMDWKRVKDDSRLALSVEDALNWCATRTSRSGTSIGGIFSYNAEGAVVHNFYSETAFVYSSAYALEAWNALHSDA